MTKLALSRDRAVIRLSGDDRRSFLQGLVTKNADLLAPEQAIFTALLTPQGKILFDFFIVEYGDSFLIDCSGASVDALVKRLMLYKLRAKITIDVDETLSVSTSEQKITTPGVIAFRDPRLADLGWRAIAVDAPRESLADYDARRIAAGVPELGGEFGPEEMFLLDVNYDALNAVNYDKGCFIGQEVTSRMKRKGDIRRRTLVADYDGPAPQRGAPISADNATIGEILGTAKERALALVRLDRWSKAQAKESALVCDGRSLNLSIPDYLKQA